jgi:uncharacterized membrane protein
VEAIVKRGATSGILFGIALAGFWDGITLHALLQWHHMISSRVPPNDMRAMQLNMFADGLFDGFCWVVTLAALVLLFREGRRGLLPSGRAYFGWILMGAGAFNFVEGIIDHEIFGIHHVHPGSDWLAWDIGFLVLLGIVPAGIGWLLTRDRKRMPAQRLRAA